MPGVLIRNGPPLRPLPRLVAPLPPPAAPVLRPPNVSQRIATAALAVRRIARAPALPEVAVVDQLVKQIPLAAAVVQLNEASPGPIHVAVDLPVPAFALPEVAVVGQLVPHLPLAAAVVQLNEAPAGPIHVAVDLPPPVVLVDQHQVNEAHLNPLAQAPVWRGSRVRRLEGAFRLVPAVLVAGDQPINLLQVPRAIAIAENAVAAGRLGEEREAARISLERDAIRLAREEEGARIVARTTADAALVDEVRETTRLAEMAQTIRLAREEEAARIVARTIADAALVDDVRETTRLAREEEAARIVDRTVADAALVDEVRERAPLAGIGHVGDRAAIAALTAAAAAARMVVTPNNDALLNVIEPDPRVVNAMQQRIDGDDPFPLDQELEPGPGPQQNIVARRGPGRPPSQATIARRAAAAAAAAAGEVAAVAPRGRPPNLANIARRAEAAAARRATAEIRRQATEARRAVLPRRARLAAIAPRAVPTIDDDSDDDDVEMAEIEEMFVRAVNDPPLAPPFAQLPQPPQPNDIPTPAANPIDDDGDEVIDRATCRVCKVNICDRVLACGHTLCAFCIAGLVASGRDRFFSLRDNLGQGFVVASHVKCHICRLPWGRYPVKHLFLN